MPEKKNQKPKKKILNLLEELTPDELEKINQPSTRGASLVDQEWLLLAEFGLKFGWQAYLDAKEDLIGGAEMLTLIEASRRLEARELYDIATASFIGAISAQSKKPSQTFKSLTKDIINQTKADE